MQSVAYRRCGRGTCASRRGEQGLEEVPMVLSRKSGRLSRRKVWLVGAVSKPAFVNCTEHRLEEVTYGFVKEV